MSYGKLWARMKIYHAKLRIMWQIPFPESRRYYLRKYKLTQNNRDCGLLEGREYFRLTEPEKCLHQWGSGRLPQLNDNE